MDRDQNPIVLLVDDIPRNIDILKNLLQQDYRIRAATSGTAALELIQRTPPDIVLLDVMMPDLDGYEVCRQLKADEKTATIPIIFVTALNEAADEEKGLSLGAVDYITKPVVPAIVRARIKTHLALANQRRASEQEVQRRTQELEQSQRSAIYMLGQAGHYNDTDTGVHIWRMAGYSAHLARLMFWPVEQAELLEQAAAMHDLGKIGIPDDILKAPRRLTEQEMEIMKRHTVIGYEILSESKTPLFALAAEVALNHHEKWDGSGYPNGLAGNDIPLSARIVAIADVFDALTMQRPYKKPWTVEDAGDYLVQNQGSHFDPELVPLFIENLRDFVEIKSFWDAKEDTIESLIPV